MKNSKFLFDKSLFIKDFLMSKDKLTLITYPHGFGKTNNGSMLTNFLDMKNNLKSLEKDYIKK